MDSWFVLDNMPLSKRKAKKEPVPKTLVPNCGNIKDNHKRAFSCRAGDLNNLEFKKFIEFDQFSRRYFRRYFYFKIKKFFFLFSLAFFFF